MGSRNKRRPKLIVDERHLRILEVILQLRWATIDQIALCVGNHVSTVQPRLKELADNRFVQGVPIQRVVVAKGGAAKTVYKLLAAGKRALNIHTGRVNFSRVPSGKLAPTFGAHTIAINDVRAYVTRACDPGHYELVQWIDEYDLKSLNDQVEARIPLKNGEFRSQTRRVTPDGYLAVRIPNKGIAHMMLELDRATEKTTTFMAKVAAYMAYIDGGGFKERYGHSAFRVLTVVDSPSDARLNTLSKLTAEYPGVGKRFWFADLERLNEMNIFEEAVWYVAGSSQLAPLLAT